MFDGMWWNTMVLISPILAAMRTASRAEMPARMFAPKKMLPIIPVIHPKTHVEPRMRSYSARSAPRRGSWLKVRPCPPSSPIPVARAPPTRPAPGHRTRCEKY